MKKGIKWTLVILGGVFVIGIVGAALGKKQPAQPMASEAVHEQQTEKLKPEPQWVTVQTLKGNGQKQSPAFHLVGGEQRLVYKYTSQMQGMGVLAVYVEEKGHDFNTEGGLPVVSSSSGKESSESYLNKSEGDYYLMVNAAGNYTVELQEKK